MNKTYLSQLKTWFSDYVAGYYTGDEQYDLPIRLKEEHTKKVCENILILCRGLQMEKQDLILAECIALCHDIGRFEQYKRYGTFNDAASENHARLGLREMGKHRILNRGKTAEKRLISKAIAYHNAPFLTQNQMDRYNLFMRLIRDADKLDVWRVLIDYYRDRDRNPNAAIELGLSNDPIFSQKIINSFHMHRSALLKDAKTLNDVILLQISWIFDLNFPLSFQLAKQRQIVEQLYGFLPPSQVLDTAVEQAKIHIENCNTVHTHANRFDDPGVP